MTLPLDDLVALAGRKKDISLEEAKHARTTKEAADDRLSNMPDERLVRPHQVASAQEDGGLAAIGPTEELRIFGHGATSVISAGAVIKVGGYTPELLAALLREMGLPRAYAGEVYLAGCLTAVGPDHGFLGAFYEQLRVHAPGVVVRGNLGKTITFPDGTQGVWNGSMTREAYDQQLAAFIEESQMLMSRLTDIPGEMKALGTGDLQKTAAAHKRLQEEALAIKARFEELPRERLAFLHQAYDATGALTVQLPAGDVRAGNAITAVVTGAVTRAEDVAAVLERIDETSFGAARTRLDELMLPIEAELQELIRRTAAL
jgi:hypothetical protein